MPHFFWSLGHFENFLKKVAGFSHAPPLNRKVGGFSKGGCPPFCTGDRRGQRPLTFEKIFRINEIHSWPETPQKESWHLVPPEKSQVAGFPCAKRQGELFSLPVRGRNGRKLAHFPPLVFPDTSCRDSRISVTASRAAAATAKLFCEV